MSIYRKKNRVRGRDRSGVRARDLLEQATCAVAKVAEASPEYDKPRTMVESMRFEGTDVLTAQDTAIYEFMLANARNTDINQEWHVLAVDDIGRFLSDDDRPVRLSRIRESVRRLGRARVTYDFRTEGARYDGDMPLVLAQIEQVLLSGTALVRYSIPAPVRAGILAATEYAMLELNAFPKFSSRYAGRLYPRLAWRAALPGRAGGRWEVEPLALAESLGYPVDGDLHLASFMRRGVEPALADINEHVAAFRVKLGEPVRGEGRGRPVERLVFEMTAAPKRFETVQAARLMQREFDAITRPDETLAHDELPSALLVGKAVTLTGLDAITLSEGWRRVYAAAKATPNAECMPGVQGGTLAFTVKRNGVGDGFALYAQAVATHGEVPAAPVPAPAPAVRLPPAPVARTAAKPNDAEAKKKEMAGKMADDLLDLLAGYLPGLGRQFKAFPDERTFSGWCDPETLPWLAAKDYMVTFDVLERALRVLGESEGEPRRKSLSNLAYAIKAWDFRKLREIAGAVLATHQAGEYQPVRPQAQRKLSGFTPTREVTEASAEYDFADPAYASGAIPWDDRDQEDVDVLEDLD